MKPIRIAVAAGVVFLSAGLASADHIRKARATLTSCTDGSPVGTVLLVEVPSSEGVKVVEVIVTAQNLPAGPHAVHVHEVASCTPCSAAGSHLDLGPHGHNVPVTENHPYHSGDLVNLRVGSDGRGALLTTTNRIALSPGNLSVFDERQRDRRPRAAGPLLHRSGRSQLCGRRPGRLRGHPADELTV